LTDTGLLLLLLCTHICYNVHAATVYPLDSKQYLQISVFYFTQMPKMEKIIKIFD